MAWTPTVTETPFGTAVTPHPANLPATVNAGDLLIAIFCWNNAAHTLASGPAGWTEKLAPTTQGTGTAACNFTIYALDAAGSEDGGTATFTTDASAEGAAQVIRIPAAEWDGDLANFQLGTAAGSLASAPDPTGVTASWGSDANLFIVFWGGADDDGTVDTYPANYTDGVDTISGAGANAGASVAVAFRELEAATDDPGAWGLSEAENNVVITGVVKPAAAGAPVTVVVPNAGSISLSANTPAVASGAQSTVPNAAEISLNAQAPGINAGTVLDVPSPSILAIDMLAPDVVAAIPAPPDDNKTGVSIGEGVSFLESVRDGRMRVGRDGVMDEAE